MIIKLIEDSNKTDFEEQINTHLADGWKLYNSAGLQGVSVGVTRTFIAFLTKEK